MYAVYKYLNGATQANVLADLVAILTGTTDVQTLSSSCDKASSLITTALTPAGWAVHDAAVPTANTMVLKAPIADNPSQFKYMWLSTNISGYFENRLYEGWNATAHSGTNMAYNDSSYNSYSQRVNFAFASGGFLYISASNRHMLIHSMSSGSTIGSASVTGPSGCVEYTRWSPWDTVSNGYLPVGSINSGGLQLGGNIYLPRIRTTSGTDSTTMYGYTYALTSTLPNSKISDASGSLIIPLVPIIVSGSGGNGWFLGGNISELANIWHGPTSYGSMLDEFSLGTGTTYVIFSSSSYRIAIPKG